MLQEEIKKYIKVNNNSDIIYYLLKYVNKTLDVLYVNENYLFENNSSERNIVFHFAKYFFLQLAGSKFEIYDLDCEYNRNKCDERGYKEIKYNYDNKKHIIYPDLILHKRGTNTQNILAIEFKKYTNYNKKSKRNDYFKLIALTDSESEFNYKLGLFIIFGATRDDVEITPFINGEQTTEKYLL